MERCALITGCSSGIGRATAAAFRAEGWAVVATARREADLDDLEKAGCHTAALDVTDPSTIERVLGDIDDMDVHIDCLVNNAGYSQPGPVEDVPTAALQSQFDVNVFGPHRLTRALLPRMRERGDGTIVNVSSILGRVSVPGAGSYCASKFALEALSSALRAEVGPLGIDVVVIEPGHVDTPFHSRSTKELDALDRTAAYDRIYSVLEDWEALTSIGPMGAAAADVADAIVNAGSATQPDARYTVGPATGLLSRSRYLPDSIRDRAANTLVSLASRRST